MRHFTFFAALLALILFSKTQIFCQWKTLPRAGVVGTAGSFWLAPAQGKIFAVEKQGKTVWLSRSDDLGLNFSKIDFPLAADTVFLQNFQSDGRSLFVETADQTANFSKYQLFESDDLGETWLPLDLPAAPTTRLPKLIALPDGEVFWQIENTLFRRQPNASGWSKIYESSQAPDVFTLDRDQQNLWLGTRAGLFKSQDDGQNWAVVQTDWHVLSVCARGGKLIAHAKPNRIFRSADDGQSWTAMPDFPASLDRATPFWKAEKGIFSYDFAQIVYSTDHFLTWKAVPEGAPIMFGRPFAAFSLGGYDFLGRPIDMFRSPAGQSNWEWFGSGLGYRSGSNYWMKAVENRFIFMNYPGSFRWWDEADERWKSSVSAHHFWSIVKKNGRWFALKLFDDTGQIWQIFTSDDFFDWKPAAQPFIFTPIANLFVDGGALVLIENNNGKINVSPDDGATWDSIGQCMELDFYDWKIEGNTIVSSRDKAIIHSKDFGKNWTEGATIQSLFGEIHGKNFAARGSKAYVNAYDSVHFSTDFGKTWTANKPKFNDGGNLGSGNIIFANDDGLFLDWGLGKLLFSPDGGQNFYDAHDGLPYPIGNENYAVADDGTTYLLDFPGNFYQLKKGALPTKNTYLAAQQLVVVPNPATDFAQIWLPENLKDDGAMLRVFSSRGELIEEIPVENRQVKIDISRWAAGIYHLSYFVDGKVFTGKIQIF